MGWQLEKMFILWNLENLLLMWLYWSAHSLLDWINWRGGRQTAQVETFKIFINAILMSLVAHKAINQNCNGFQPFYVCALHLQFNRFSMPLGLWSAFLILASNDTELIRVCIPRRQLIDWQSSGRQVLIRVIIQSNRMLPLNIAFEWKKGCELSCWNWELTDYITSKWLRRVQ